MINVLRPTFIPVSLFVSLESSGTAAGIHNSAGVLSIHIISASGSWTSRAWSGYNSLISFPKLFLFRTHSQSDTVTDAIVMPCAVDGHLNGTQHLSKL